MYKYYSYIDMPRELLYFIGMLYIYMYGPMRRFQGLSFLVKGVRFGLNSTMFAQDSLHNYDEKLLFMHVFFNQAETIACRCGELK